MFDVCDFTASFLTFEMKGVNTARINLDARCRWIGETDGETEDFVLICSCQGEKMYRTEDLIHAPPYNFLGVFSAKQSHLIRDHADADIDRDTVEDHGSRFSSVRIDVARFSTAVELTTGKEIAQAALRNLPLIGRTELAAPGGRARVVMEYPITTMNVEPSQGLWQVDTGPMLFFDFLRSSDRRIDRLVPAFIVFNRTDYAELALRAPTPLPKGGQTHHYADLRRVAVRNRIFSGVPL